MFYYLKGQIVVIDEDKAVIDVNGVGYEFYYINTSSFKLNNFYTVYTYHIVREDDELLIGFENIEEKEFFIKLIAVKGIGPKTAISALRGTTVQAMKAMINTDDIKSLKKLPGIGAKAAGQIILDMKGSITKNVVEQTSTTSVNASVKLNAEQEDAKSVLKTLGFKPKDIDEVLAKLPVSLLANQYVEECLKRLGK